MPDFIQSMNNELNCFQDDSNEMDKVAFMQEVERDAARRHDERKEREAVAQNLRK